MIATIDDNRVAKSLQSAKYCSLMHHFMWSIVVLATCTVIILCISHLINTSQYWLYCNITYRNVTYIVALVVINVQCISIFFIFFTNIHVRTQLFWSISVNSKLEQLVHMQHADTPHV